MKWSEALVSGKYKQGDMELRTIDDKYCCLGVLCDILPDVEWQKDGKTYLAHFPSGELEGGGFNSPDAEAVGLDKTLTWLERSILTAFGLILDEGATRQSALWSMNDGREMNFATIAGFITLFGWDIEVDDKERITE